MSLTLQQDEKYQGNDWWKWSVWIVGSPGEVEAVRSVEYHLHPTFTPSKVVIDTPANGFRLDSSGWENSRSTRLSTSTRTAPTGHSASATPLG